MKIFVSPCILVVAILLITSCQKAINSDASTPVPDPVDSIPAKPPVSVEPDKIVVASFIGRILDEKGEPLKDAEASAGGKKGFTDEFGIFRIKDATVSEQSSFIIVKKPGYLTGSRTVISQAGGKAFVQIKMIRKVLKGSFNADDGASLYFGGSAGVKFPANAIMNATGELYSGKVFVYGTMYDPIAGDFSDVMPGDLRGITADSQVTALTSYGMLNVELETEAGDALQLAKGKKAQITISVASALVAGAPAEIPLWHFGEVDGKWREEGKAMLKDGVYHGEVSHFSTWNCDVPYDFVFIKLRIKGPKGISIPYSTLRITDLNTNRFNISIADSLGNVIMAVPKNSKLRAEVLNECGIILGTQNYSPQGTDTDLGIISINQEKAIVLEGNVFSCYGKPAENGFVTLFSKGLYYVTEISNGKYQLSLNSCWQLQSKATLFAYDASGSNNSGTINLTITGTDTKVPDLTVCGNNVDEFLSFRIDNDNEVLITIPPDSTAFFRNEYNQTKIEFFKNSRQYGQGTCPYFALYDTVPYVSDIEHGLMMWHKGIEYVPKTVLHLEVKEYGKPGEYIHFTFSGELCRYPSLLESHTITGEGKIRRPY